MVLYVCFMRPLLVWRGYWIDEGYVMSGFKGTPGPWRVNVLGQHWNNKTLTHLEVTFGSDGECICDTVYKIDDANLIAAAPELLEALQAALEWIDAVPQDVQLPTMPGFDRDWVDGIIAKALGRS